MTEAEWLGCADPRPMLEFLRDRAGERKLRLFAVACCRYLQSPWPSPPEYNVFLEWAELFADGAASPEDLAVIGEEVTEYVSSAARTAAHAAPAEGAPYRFLLASRRAAGDNRLLGPSALLGCT